MGEGVINANMGTTYEMLCNLEQALEHHDKVKEGEKKKREGEEGGRREQGRGGGGGERGGGIRRGRIRIGRGEGVCTKMEWKREGQLRLSW